MSSFGGRSSGISSIPIYVELGLASVFSLLILTKPKTKGNFPLLIAYSSFKLLALCSLLARNMNLFGLGHIPFYVGLLINEVVLLVLSIRLRDVILSNPFNKLYPAYLRVIRFLSELSTVGVLVGVVAMIPIISCSCNIQKEVIGEITIRYCTTSNTNLLVGSILKDQIRGLAFAITVTASVVAISSMRFMASSIGREVTGKADRDVIQWMMMDAGWKQAVRTVYGVLGMFINALFVGSFFYPGTNDCLINEDGVSFGYGLGTVPAALLNAIFAISQVFMADMLLRISAKTQTLAHTKPKILGDSDSSIDTELGPPPQKDHQAQGEVSDC